MLFKAIDGSRAELIGICSGAIECQTERICVYYMLQESET